MSDYTSNATPQAIAAFMKAQTSLVILTHAKPDGDALGSALTVLRVAEHIGIDAQAWFVGPFPAWLGFFAGSSAVCKLGGDSPSIPDFDPSGIVIVDTGAWSQLKPLDAWLKPRTGRAVVIDHHLHGQGDVAHLRLVTPASASCTEALAPVVDELLGVPGRASLPIDIGTPMYLGLATDTGWFRFSNTTADTFELAARLVNGGVDHPAIYQAVEQQQAPLRPRLLGLALASLTYEHGGRVGVMALRDADMRALGAIGEDTGGFAEPVLAVQGVQVVATLTEMPAQPDGTPLVKVSLRSKPGPEAIDVAAIANKLGGGGHARAAGIKLHLPLPEAIEAITSALDGYPGPAGPSATP